MNCEFMAFAESTFRGGLSRTGLTTDLNVDNDNRIKMWMIFEKFSKTSSERSDKFYQNTH